MSKNTFFIEHLWCQLLYNIKAIFREKTVSESKVVKSVKVLREIFKRNFMFQGNYLLLSILYHNFLMFWLFTNNNVKKAKTFFFYWVSCLYCTANILQQIILGMVVCKNYRLSHYSIPKKSNSILVKKSETFWVFIQKFSVFRFKSVLCRTAWTRVY